MRVFLLVICYLSAVAWADTATVNDGTRVNLRSGKTDNYRVIRSLEPGSQVELLAVEAGYAQVKTTEGDSGWLPLRLIKIAPSPKRNQSPAQLEADNRLQEMQGEMAKLKSELDQAQQRAAAAVTQPWQAYAIGAAAFVFGVIFGMLGLQAYYRRKLNGLRI
jgi:uncharacterized protein YgiM (DUF1202 family)